MTELGDFDELEGAVFGQPPFPNSNLSKSPCAYLEFSEAQAIYLGLISIGK
jgi:hypothetical protein